jgi:hypothetical protein
MARTTIIMVAVFTLMAGGAFALEKLQPQKTDQTVYVLEVKDADVQRLDIAAAAGPAAFERAEPFGWKFADSGSQADLSRVSSVVNRLAKLRSSAKVTDQPSDLPKYGLSPPADTATLTLKDGLIYKVLIGSKTPNDAAYYALVEGKNELHTINTLLVGDIEKLVSDPPVPSPTPDATASSTPRIAGTSSPSSLGAVEPTTTSTPTIGLPAPRVE